MVHRETAPPQVSEPEPAAGAVTGPCPLCGCALTPPPALGKTDRCPRCHGRVLRTAEGPEIRRPGPGFFLTDIVDGFAAVFAGGIWLFTRPEYTGKLLLPLAANVVVLGLVGFGMWWGFTSAFEWLLGGEWVGWLQWLQDALAAIDDVVAGALALVCLFFLLPVIIETVLGPFLDPIANATDRMLAGDDFAPVPMSIWRNIYVSARSAAQILALQLVVLLAVVVLSFCGGFGILIAIPLAAWFNALIWFEIPFVRRGYGMLHRRAVLRRNWARAFGFGLGFQVGLLVPVFNLVLLAPATAVAASALYFRFDKSPDPR